MSEIVTIAKRTEEGLRRIINTVDSVEIKSINISFMTREKGWFCVYPEAEVKVIGSLGDMKYKEYEELQKIAKDYSFRNIHFISLDTQGFGPSIGIGIGDGVIGSMYYTINMSLIYDGEKIEKTITSFHINTPSNKEMYDKYRNEIKDQIEELVSLGYKDKTANKK